MGNKASDEICRQNYDRLRSLFDSAVEDNSRFEMVYAYGMDVGLIDALIVRVTTSTYSSYAVGFDKIANEIAILPVSVDLSSHSQPFYLKNRDIKKAKRGFISKEITIYDDRLPKKYIQFNVPEFINEDPDDVVLLVKQDEEAKQFQKFFKERFSK